MDADRYSDRLKLMNIYWGASFRFGYSSLSSTKLCIDLFLAFPERI